MKSAKRCKGFGLYRHGERITEVPLRKQVATGIQVIAPVEGVVPEFEEREASLFCGYTWREWLLLSRPERAAGIAHFRGHHLLEAHSNDAITAHMERQAKAGSSNV
jgi:hypothetical protein